MDIVWTGERREISPLILLRTTAMGRRNTFTVRKRAPSGGNSGTRQGLGNCLLERVHGPGGRARSAR